MKTAIRTVKSKLLRQTAAIGLNVLPEIGDLIRRKLMIVLVMLGMSFGLLLAGGQSAAAQSALDGFDPNANEAVRAIVVQPDGKIIIGGDFTSVLGTARNYIARLNPDGTLDTSFDPNANNGVTSIAIQSDGKILVGGAFDSIGGQTRNYIARLNTDGTLDSFDPNADGVVRSIAIQSDGKILVGGQFNSIGGQTRSRLARLNTDGTADSFNPNANNTVFSIAIQSDSKIVVGGFFTSIGGQARSRLARLNTDGTADSFDPNANNFVYSIAVQSDGKILVGGGFSSIGGQARNCIARLNTDGTADSFDPNADNQVYSVAVQSDGKILVVGLFTSIGGQTRNRIARLNTDGTADSFDPNAGNTVLSIAVQSDGKILVGGLFTSIGGQTRNRFARLERDGTLDRTLNSLNIIGNVVFTTATQPDGKIIIGGLFSSVLGSARNNIARLNPDGTLDAGFNPNANDYVTSITIQSDGKILVGGLFTTIGGQTRNSIARLNTDGTADSFNPNPSNPVTSIAVQTDGKILVGGNFSSIGGQAHNRIARLNTDGTLDSFNPNPNSSVISLAIQSDGKILVGGAFTSIGGQTRNRIARLNTDGTADSFNPGADDIVWSIATQTDGKILVGGDFIFIGGQTRNRIARLNSDGTLDSFNPNPNSQVSSMAIQSDGKILVGGFFTTIGGQTRNSIARLNTDGTADSFNPNPSNVVTSLAIQSDGKILVGGGFSSIGGQTRNRIARLSNDTAALSSLSVSQSEVTLTRDGSAAQFTRVVFEQSVDDGANWTTLGQATNSFASSAAYTLTGLSLPTGQNILIRARGYSRTGTNNGSETIEDKVQIAFLQTTDATPPVITPTVTGTLGNNGWYTSNVQVSWTVTDDESSVSNQTGCDTQNVTADTNGVTFTCEATSGGGTDSQSVTVKRDATAPSITFVSRTAPNANGWNNSNVAVQWNCSDVLSGAASPTVSNIVSTEGANQSALGICTDNAGNAAQNTQNGISIDKTAPQIVVTTRTPPANFNGWNNTNVTVTWNCSDAGSGATSATVSNTVSSEGANQSAVGTCVDLAGNSASHTYPGINIDKTAPVITFDSRTAPNSNGWNNTDISVNWNCSDTLSGVVNSAVNQIVSSEGSNQSTAGTCFDLAGNTAQNTQTGINIDKTAPSITLDSRTAANANGWNNTDVALVWNCADALSGAVNPSVNQNVSTEGANQSAAGICVDLAGNSISDTQSGINIDKTAPLIMFDFRTAPNANGWNNTDVVVSWNCSDALSNAANASVNQTVSGEGANLSVVGTCTDLAGNSISDTQSGINIDKIAPQITFDSRTAANANGWNNTNVSVNWNCSDSGAGAVTPSVNQIVSSEGAGLSSTGTCSDLAGNSASNTQTGINIDKTAPTISFVSRTAPNANGWNNTDVTVNWSCGDTLSGAASSAFNLILMSEGANQSSTGTCFDLAGNLISDTQTSINIDKTAPTLAPTVTPNPVQLNGTATATANAADGLSGIASQSCATVDTSTVGLKSLTCTTTDLAGNTASANVTYQVNSGFNFTGFFQPVDNLPMLNIGNAGQAIPLKFSLGGYQGLNIFAAGYPASSQIPCDANEPGSTIEETVNAGGSSLTYDATTNRYTYVWKTNKAWKGTCRILVVRLTDGSEHFAKFRFR